MLMLNLELVERPRELRLWRLAFLIIRATNRRADAPKLPGARVENVFIASASSASLLSLQELCSKNGISPVRASAMSCRAMSLRAWPRSTECSRCGAIRIAANEHHPRVLGDTFLPTIREPAVTQLGLEILGEGKHLDEALSVGDLKSSIDSRILFQLSASFILGRRVVPAWRILTAQPNGHHADHHFAGN